MSEELIEQHNAWQSFLFRSKVFAFTGKRMLSNVLNGTKRHRKSVSSVQTPVIAESRTELWNKNDTTQNWILTAGKIENLRIAIKAINQLEIPANTVFSFWKHIGNPNIGKGYVTGREIREGCLIPTKAGGLCQLSNALYDAALKANFTIVERHKHTKVVRGSLAEQDRDATVKWNYVDLRFQSDYNFRIEAFLTDSELVIRFRSERKAIANNSAELVTHEISAINDCYSCGKTSCHKHPTGQLLPERNGTVAFIVDEGWPEYVRYAQEQLQASDTLICSVYNSRILRSANYKWSCNTSSVNRQSANFAALKRSFRLRLAAKQKRNPFKSMLKEDALLVRAMAKRIPIDTTHIVVSQNLLPELWAAGALGGRTFDVLMTRLPMGELHNRLDQFYLQHPESPTLKDFRAPQELIDLENEALNAARKIITPHRGIASLFSHKTILLDWILPPLQKNQGIGTDILFPASAVGRKGAYEIKALAESLNLEITVLGNATEYAGFWGNVRVKPFSGLDKIALVVFPTLIEHQPRMLLKAIALGIPVVTTKAAGLPEMEGVTLVPEGNVDALKEAVNRILVKPVIQPVDASLVEHS